MSIDLNTSEGGRYVAASAFKLFDRIRVQRRKGGGGGHSSSHSSSHSSTSDESSSSSSKAKFSSSSKSSTFDASEASKAFEISSGTASAYSDGGGSRFTLPVGSVFAGRTAGSGTRNGVYGTSRYGSGYIYGANNSYVSGRPFPFVFIPVVFADDYYGSEEYENVNDRPGGNLTTVSIRSSNDSIESSTYHIIGDKSSVEAVFTAIVLNCSVINDTSAISSYIPSRSALPQPEQIVQWYRASTFALAFDGYNNTAATYANMPSSPSEPALSLSDDTPLPSTMNHTFLECLNQTIGASIPLVDTSASKHVTFTEVLEYASAAAFGLAILFCLLRCLLSCCGCCCIRSERRKKKELPKATVVNSDSSLPTHDLSALQMILVDLKGPPAAYGAFNYRYHKRAYY